MDNAVKHAISKRTAGGEIRITVTARNGELQLEVRYNGPGPKHGVIPSSDLGLRITRDRLQSLYGQHQSVELLSAPEGGGTLMWVCIPFRVEPRDDARDSAEAYQIPAAERRFKLAERFSAG